MWRQRVPLFKSLTPREKYVHVGDGEPMHDWNISIPKTMSPGRTPLHVGDRIPGYELLLAGWVSGRFTYYADDFRIINY